MKRRSFLAGLGLTLAAAGFTAWRFSWITRRIFIKSGLMKPPSNLLRNADFAQCTNPDMPDYWGSEDAASFADFSHAIRVERDGPLAGVRSVRLSGATQQIPITLQSCGTFLPKQVPYTLSVYLRSARSGAIATLAIGFGEARRVTLDQRWRRFQITHAPTRQDELEVGVQTRISSVDSADLWLAAPQLEEGAVPTDFSTALMDDHPLPVFPTADKDERWSCATSPSQHKHFGNGFPATVFGIACSDPSAEQLADIRAHGFDCLALPLTVDYGDTATSGRYEDVLKQFDMAHNHAMKVLPMLSHQNATRVADVPNATARCISALKHHPAILAWCILDEPTVGLRKIGYRPTEDSVLTYRAAKAADPQRPAFINENVWRSDEWLTKYMLATDIASRDVYPIGRYQNAVSVVAASVSNLAQQAERAHKPGAFWLQLFGTREAPREPTPAECRAMTYVVFIDGIRSIFYWAYKPASGSLWSAVASSRNEITKIADYLSQEGECRGRGTQNIFVHYTIWTVGRTAIVVACNTHDGNTTASFDLNKLSGHQFARHAVWYGAMRDEVAGSILTVHFGPYDRYVAVFS